MGVAEMIVAICLQAEPSACRITRERLSGGFMVCAIHEDSEPVATGWYLARWTCRWRG